MFSSSLCLFDKEKKQLLFIEHNVSGTLQTLSLLTYTTLSHRYYIPILQKRPLWLNAQEPVKVSWLSVVILGFEHMPNL